MSPFENILVKQKDNVGLITFNRPKALNALCEALMIELTSALDDYEANEQIGGPTHRSNDMSIVSCWMGFRRSKY